ncbi:MAG TPA: phosphoenolpyruvate carboxykinase (ATP) [Opitutales bacterium]|nr:phosphoenolpyruvate carboxykinase (ATP) [Opitutales bacterium]
MNFGAESLGVYGIRGKKVLRNAAPAVLYEEAIRGGDGDLIAANGCLLANSGERTGRSPLDKRIVRNPESEKDIWWGDVNIPLTDESFTKVRQRAIDYLNDCSQLYVFDGFAGWNKRYRQKIRVISSRPYHALFMHNMLVRPTAEELADFGEPDYVIFNAGAGTADPSIEGISSTTSVSLSLERGEFVILGTEYAGEMKKGVFTVMNYLMPKRDVLSMHCSANEGEAGDVALFFGLSGTGKTTLSTDPNRWLIGDDEHCWSDEGVFNIEGGCYAKGAGLEREKEPEIWDALRFGALLENVVCDEETREVDFDDVSLTENTRACYPIEHIDRIKKPCEGPQPNNILFLTCDAFGVLPPVSKLDPEQARYYFINGYTAKIPGTEQGVTEPEAVFSACFGAPFLVWHPMKYAEMLAEKAEAVGARFWLVNTGWSGGGYGVGKRIALAHTRAIVQAILSGSLAEAGFNKDRAFDLSIPKICPGVPTELLDPRLVWKDKAAYDQAAERLKDLFEENYASFKAGGSSVDSASAQSR